MGIANRHLGRWQRQADAAIKLANVKRIDRHRGRALGEAITFDQGRFGQDLPALGHRALYGSTAPHRQAQTAEIDFADIRMVQQAIKKRIDRRQRHDAVAHQQFHKSIDIARVRHQHIRSAQPSKRQAGA